MDIAIDYDLSPEDLVLAQDLLPEFYNPNNVGPRLIIRNWDKEFEEDISNGNGFLVKSKPFKKKIKDKDGNILSKGIKEMDGIHSPRFGSDWFDDNAFADRYSCECGNLVGRIYEGEKCTKCNTKVKFIDVDLRIFAWMKIEHPEFKLIQPMMYKKIQAFLPKGVLESIIDFKIEMGLDGYYDIKEDMSLKNPFNGIGMFEFYKRFDEIMKFYAARRKNKVLLYEHIMDNRDRIFTSCVPVYSAVLRDVFFINEEYSYGSIDKQYNALYGNIVKLNEENEVHNYNIAKINKNLYKAQTNLNNAWDLIFTSINDRDGLIRRNILGGRMNFSSRCVIIPDASLRSYQIRIPYVCFLEMWKPEIINTLVKLDGIRYDTAVNRWFDGYREFDPKIYSIIEYIMKHTKGGCKCMLNRNPKFLMGLMEVIL